MVTIKSKRIKYPIQNWILKNEHISARYLLHLEPPQTTDFLVPSIALSFFITGRVYFKKKILCSMKKNWPQRISF